MDRWIANQGVAKVEEAFEQTGTGMKKIVKGLLPEAPAAVAKLNEAVQAVKLEAPVAVAKLTEKVQSTVESAKASLEAAKA